MRDQMELSEESSQRVGRAANKQQQEQRKVDHLRPKPGRFGMVFVICCITFVVTLSALVGPSVSLASDVRSGIGDTSGSGAAGATATATASVSLSTEAAATVVADSQDIATANTSSSAPVDSPELEGESQRIRAASRLDGGNGHSIRGRKRKASRIESGQPLWVSHVHDDNKQQQQEQEQRILKKFGSQDLDGPFDQVNSADLPAEFRDESSLESGQKETEAPREQSKLAKLCEQTSSVLASVLPAPFGGHKRSILCQFFGQVPMAASGGRKGSSKTATSSKDQGPVDSVAVIHPFEQFSQQQPIMLMRPMKHPIELLLEHQRQQMQLAARVQQQERLPVVQDLKSSASVLDYSYQQRLEAPKMMMQQSDELSQKKPKAQEKFSQPIKVSSSPMLSTSGWRIYENLPEQVQHSNQSSAASSPQTQSSTTASTRPATSGPPKAARDQPTETNSKSTNQSSAGGKQVSTAAISSTTAAPQPASSSTAAAAQPQTAASTISIQRELNLSREKLGAAQLLVLGRPPNYAARGGQQSAAAKKSEETYKVTQQNTRKLPEQPELRTIEVIAQSSNATSSPQSHTDLSATARDASSSQKVADSPSIQKPNREELVIASINNLTRIAFGNQLRDTFKVINRLIDQQADLFASPAAPKSDTDSLMTSESQKSVRKTPVDAVAGEPKKRTKSREKDILPSSSSATSKMNTQSPKTNKRTTPTIVSKRLNATETLQPLKRQQLSSTTLTSVKASRSLAKNNHHSDMTNSDPIELKHSERKSTLSGLESRRSTSSHSVSRSLSLDFTRKTTALKPLAPFESSWPTTTFDDDIRRDKSSRNKANPEIPIKSSSDALQNQLVQQAAATRYPWRSLDEKSTDLFGWSTQTTALKRQPTATTSKRWIPKTTMDSSALAGTTRKRTLVLNRLDNKRTDRPTTKLDSLTTLKMSLGSSQREEPSSPTSTMTAAESATTLAHSVASSSTQSGIQSRWVPTLGLTGPTRGETRQWPSTITTPAATTSSSTTSMPPTQNTSLESSEPKADTTSKAPPTQSDLMEARASDSISKFTTTHWNEANELLATTRRLFQQPQPQIAQTGEFFSAETISSWPERYQTMLENNLKSTVAMETTRRSGETYSTGEQETVPPTTATAGTKLARHRYDATTFATEQQQQTTRRMDQPDLTGVTVLPANHKLSTTRDEAQSAGTIVDLAAQKATTSLRPYEELTTLSPKQSNQTGSMRPPYLELQQADSVGSMAADKVLNGPVTTSRAAYEELLKSSTTASKFLGTHNHLAHQGLNLSALKLLSQGLFATLGNADRNRSLISPPVEQSIGSSIQHKVADAEALNNSDRLLEMLGAQNSSLFSMLPMSQYELLLNGTSSFDATAGESNNSENKGNSSSKWLLGRASNLLNDLKQLEQRKAAALLAAIRYQVPGPLVRPWDLNSDLQQANDRFDSAESEAERDYLRAGLWLSKASDLIRGALMKQRVVPRNELEARLSGRKFDSREAASTNSDRRTDSDDIENSLALLGGNRTTVKQDANYVLVAGNSSSSDDNIDEAPSELLQKILLAQKPRPVNSKRRQQENEFESYELASEDQRATSRNDKSVQQYPKYIHLSDYKTNWSPRPVDLQPKSFGQLSSSAAIAARLRNNTSNLRRETSKPEINIEGAKQLDKETQNQSLQSFDCSEKPSGFHPDVSSNCQTFYHCSSTGHLLTFSCPQQTRFDQRSLKCGPWYEVSCDLGRPKIRQHPLTAR